MFLPINDSESNHYSAFPIVTVILILLNIVIFFVEIFLSNYIPVYSHVLFGSVPRLIFEQQGGGALASLTSTFLHGGFFHLIGNMPFLWTFGRRVEDACGPWRFLLFYLTCGICADLLSTLIRFNDHIPSIGASGAIFGLLGAHLLLFPGGRIRTLITIPLPPFLLFPNIRGFWIVMFYFLVQLVPAWLAANGGDYSTNYFAHLGGFFACITVILFLRPEAFSRYLSNEPV